MRKILSILFFSFLGIVTIQSKNLVFYTGDLAPEISYNEKSYYILLYQFESPKGYPVVKEVRNLGNGKGYMTIYDYSRPGREVTYNFTVGNNIYIYLKGSYAIITAESNYTYPGATNLVKQRYKVTSITDNKLVLTLQ